VVSGPSGSGKDTLVDALRRLEPNLAYSVSATTRAPRPGEENGVHYRFLDRPAFERMLANDEFLETREYAGNLYGTPKNNILETLSKGKDMVLKPEVNGAMAVKKAFPRAALVFLTVPSEEDLWKRLIRRGTESEAAIKHRLEIAKEENVRFRTFDYLIINAVFDEALAKLHAILVAERLKVARVLDREP